VNDDELSDPPNPSPEPEPEEPEPEEPEPEEPEPQRHRIDVKSFFTRYDSAGNRICKLCSYVRISSFYYGFLTISSAKFGDDASSLGSARYAFSPSTSISILREHLYRQHLEEIQVSPDAQSSKIALDDAWPPSEIEVCC
jgi:hypothetical protein